MGSINSIHTSHSSSPLVSHYWLLEFLNPTSSYTPSYSLSTQPLALNCEYLSLTTKKTSMEITMGKDGFVSMFPSLLQIKNEYE
jgi:hypothetical protein